MTAKRRPAAMERLDDAVRQLPLDDDDAVWNLRWRAYRRALRALLAERAEAGMNAVEACNTEAGFRRVCLAVYAAVLGRRGR